MKFLDVFRYFDMLDKIVFDVAIDISKIMHDISFLNTIGISISCFTTESS